MLIHLCIYIYLFLSEHFSVSMSFIEFETIFGLKMESLTGSKRFYPHPIRVR